MRYFRSGKTGVARVHVKPDAPLDDALSRAKAEVFNFKRGGWREHPDVTAEIRFTGDWNPCSQVEAERLISDQRGPVRAAIPDMRATTRWRVTHLLTAAGPRLHCGSRDIGSRAVAMYPGAGFLFERDPVFVIEGVDDGWPPQVVTSGATLADYGVTTTPVDTEETIDISNWSLYQASRVGRPRNPDIDAHLGRATSR